jgi:ATP/maltotriose-dependent transcriptional regulator MalT/DNA-binding SARP family transcriptional activator
MRVRHSVNSQGSTQRVTVPRLRPSILPRPRLVNRLHASLGEGLVVLHAPAGFGKTTLLDQFANDPELQYRVVSLSLDSACVVPEVFAERTAVALAGASPFRPPSAVGRPGDLKAYLAANLTEALERSAVPLLLIFDNIQEISGDEDSVDLLGWLIEAAAEGVEVVLSGRELPPLSQLHERIASGSAVLIGSAELAFDEAECEAARARCDSPLTAAALIAETDGWPVGVLAILSGALAADSSLHRQQAASWEHYLATYVWEGVPAALKQPLLRLSLLSIIQPGVARRLTSAAQWRDLASWLTAHDFLYEPVGAEDLRLNPLLRGFLRGEFERIDPADFHATVGALIDQADREDRVADALELARAPGQEERLALLLEARSQRLIHLGAFPLLSRAFGAVPAYLIEERPLLAAFRARVYSHTLRIFEALEAATALLADPAVRGAARINAALARMRCLRMLGTHDELFETIRSVRAIGDCDDQAILGELTYHEAEIELSVNADFAKAERLLRLTIGQCDAAGIQPLGLLASSTLGQLLTMRGDAPGAVTVLTRAAQGWRSIGRSSNLGWVLNNLGMAHLQVGDFESALHVLDEARREGLQCENQRNAAYAIASLGDAELALGHWDRARVQYEEAIRICAEDAPDETLAALSIAGLAGALLGLGDIQQADYFVKRAVLVSTASANSFELASCKLQEAAVESIAGNHTTAIAVAMESLTLFEKMDTRTSLCAATYRLALCQFRAGKRPDAQATLRNLDALITEPWMTGSLAPLVRENPMFAQWAASRNLAGQAFRTMIERTPFQPEADDDDDASIAPVAGRFPPVTARSLGAVSVAVGGREVTEEAWSSLRAKELFFLFLANPTGLRKEEAVERLYPELAPEKCNSAFHSNLYRLRRALYQESVVKRDGEYVLNPDGSFTWDAEQFEALLSSAESLPAGSPERADTYQKALALYSGPFAEAFYSEWAEATRRRLEERSNSALASVGGYFAGRGDFQAAAGCMERVLEANRFNEEAAYALATYRMRAGQTVAALAFIDDYRRSYESELGERLPERFSELRASIASGAGA